MHTRLIANPFRFLNWNVLTYLSIFLPSQGLIFYFCFKYILFILNILTFFSNHDKKFVTLHVSKSFCVLRKIIFKNTAQIVTLPLQLRWWVDPVWHQVPTNIQDTSQWFRHILYLSAITGQTITTPNFGSHGKTRDMFSSLYQHCTETCSVKWACLIFTWCRKCALSPGVLPPNPTSATAAPRCALKLPC